jgi:hypothetical protein
MTSASRSSVIFASVARVKGLPSFSQAILDWPVSTFLSFDPTMRRTIIKLAANMIAEKREKYMIIV